MGRFSTDEAAVKMARAVVRRHLDAAVEAARRLGDPYDVEALHDCRVAIRRLRVTLRAYRPLLKPGVPKQIRDALSALASQTGPARDAEVFVGWLERRATRLRGAARSEAERLLEQVVMRRDSEYRRLRTLIPRALGMIEPLLRLGLAIRGQPRAPLRLVTFGQFTARCVDEQVRRFRAALARVRGPADHERVHAARIAAKKVRYLLEAALTKRGAGVLKQFRRVQDVLGEFHDLGEIKRQVVSVRRGRTRGGVLASRGPRPGIAAIVASVEREERALFRTIERELLVPSPRCLVPVRRWIRRHAPRPDGVGAKPASP